jgi:putative flippase GtrA
VFLKWGSLKISLSPNQSIRYLINGCTATVIHYAVLSVVIEMMKLQSAAAANIIASFFAITISFLGNRYYVFKLTVQPIFKQLYKFLFCYMIIALIHGSVLFIWTDYLNFDYKIGFLLAISIQVILGYWVNKKSVFTVYRESI